MSTWPSYSFRAALGERRHRGLARRRVAVRRRAVLMLAKGERPRPRHSDRRAVGEHVIAVLVPIAGWAARRYALEN